MPLVPKAVDGSARDVYVRTTVSSTPAGGTVHAYTVIMDDGDLVGYIYIYIYMQFIWFYAPDKIYGCLLELSFIHSFVHSHDSTYTPRFTYCRSRGAV